MIPSICQRDKEWRDVIIGDSNETIGESGCTICCISMGAVWAGLYRSPEWIAYNCRFTKEGRILWDSVKVTESVEFVWRNYVWSFKRFHEAFLSETEFAIIEIEWRKNSRQRHWIFPIGVVSATKLMCIDPWTGKRIVYDTEGKNGLFRYGKATGMAILKKMKK
jgi:hypothetical protein